jgi:peptidyl-prolyl cis-trans isomerase SurA
MKSMKHIKILAAIAVFMAPLAPEAQSSNPYATAITVNDRVVTNFEILQRVLMLQLFGSRGDLNASARNTLVDERLYLQAATQLNAMPSEIDIENGMDEFAARGKLSTEQLIQILGSRGVARESFRAFVTAGLAWRNVVRARFARQTNITDDDINSALSFQNGPGQLDFLVSEIIMSDGGQSGESAQKIATRLSRSIKSSAAFAAAARKYSNSASARSGGRLSWVPSRALPANIVAQLLILRPGQVTGPISMNGNIALFQLRDTRKGNGGEVASETLSYSTVTLPTEKDAKTTAAKARVLRNSVDNCLDMRAAGQKISENSFDEGAGTVQEIPSNFAIALASLDDKETTTIAMPNGQTGVIMLCSRTQELIEGERETIRDSLFNQKIANLGAGYLQELKGDAFITYK